MPVDERLIYAAIIISILSLGGVVYTSYKVATTLEDQGKTIMYINESLQALTKTDDVKDRLESLALQIQELQTRLQEYPTKEDLQLLQERLQFLEEKLNVTYDALFFPAEIVDGTGDIVVVPSKPQRIVSLAPAVTEILYYVGADDRIVGVDEFSNWPEWIAEARENGTIVNIGGFWSPNVEAILSTNPDLVIGVAGATPHHQIKKILSAYGIPVILLPQESLTDIKRSLIIVGTATGNVAEAVRAAQEFDSSLARIQIAVNQTPRSVALIVWVNPLWVAGSGTFQGDMIVYIGATNAFENVTGWSDISPELLVEVAPDVIILSGVDRDTFYQFITDTLGDSASQIPAIRDDLVFCLTYPYTDLLNRPSPRVVDGLVLLQYIVYPEIYGTTWDDIPRCINQTSLPEIPAPPAP